LRQRAPKLKHQALGTRRQPTANPRHHATKRHALDPTKRHATCDSALAKTSCTLRQRAPKLKHQALGTRRQPTANPRHHAFGTRR
jgi:hypothetical protein